MFYNLLKVTLILLFSTVFRWRVQGRENIPASGSVIIAPNHCSNADPLLVGAASNRRVRFMAKEELFSPPWFGSILKHLGSIPVKRGVGDRAAIRQALDVLQAGNAFILFPEGTRSKNGQLNQAQHGVAMIAIKSQTPVIPAAISGTFRFFRKGNWFPRFTVNYGSPIIPPVCDHLSKETMEEFSRKIMAEIAILLKEYN
jgi:1-acyl-sn-glycerol-3-phosphate acyltransferase